MSNYSLIQINDLDKGVVNIQLNSPETQNTLSEKMIGELQQALDDLQQGPSKVIILSSTGKVFSAGHDLRELKSARSQSDQGHAYFQKILKWHTTTTNRLFSYHLFTSNRYSSSSPSISTWHIQWTYNTWLKMNTLK